MPAERVRQRFRTDRLARSRRAGEIESQRESGRMPLTKSPAIKDEVVLSDLRQRSIQCALRCGWQNDVRKRAARNNGLQSAAAARLKEAGKRNRHHDSNVQLVSG